MENVTTAITREQQKAIWNRMVAEAQHKNKTGFTKPSKGVYSPSSQRLTVLKPSQWVNFGWFLLIPTVIGLLVWICNSIIISCWQYQFEERAIVERKGVFSVLTTEINYFRIKSVRMEEPFFYRLVGLSNVVLLTSDPMIPYMKLYAVRNGQGLKNALKDKAIYWREKMGVKETDFHSF